MARASSKPVYINPTLNDKVFGFKKNGEDVTIPLNSIYNLIKISTTGIPHNYICDSSALEQGKFVPDSLVFNEITRFKLNNLDSYGSDMLSFFSLLSSKKDDLFLKINILGKSDFAVYKISSIDYSYNDFIIEVSLYKNISVGELTLKDNCYFDFLLEREPDFSDTQLDRLKDSVYLETVKSISVLPSSFEKGLATNLVFTWNVDKKDDTLGYVQVDGITKTEEATGINRTYTVENEVASKTVTLTVQATKNNTVGGSYTTNTQATATAIIPQYYGKVASADVPLLTYVGLQTYTKFLSASSAKSVNQSYTNEKLFFLSINANAIIKDINGFDVTSAFTKSTVTMKLADGTDQSITQYLLTNPINSTGTYTIN